MQTMKIWVLKAIGDKAPYDTVDGFVVRAKSAQQARQLAAANRMNEGAQFWLDPALSTCRVLPVDGPADVILRDANAV